MQGDDCKVRLTIDGQAYDHRWVCSLFQTEPFPGGHEYVLTISGRNVRKRFDWLESGNYEHLDRDFCSRVFWEIEPFICMHGIRVEADPRPPSYFLNSIRQLAVAAEEIRIKGICSEVLKE